MLTFFATMTDLFNAALENSADMPVVEECITAAVFGQTPGEFEASVEVSRQEAREYAKRNPNNGWDLPRGVSAQNDTLFPGYYLGNSYEAGIVD